VPQRSLSRAFNLLFPDEGLEWLKRLRLQYDLPFGFHAEFVAHALDDVPNLSVAYIFACNTHVVRDTGLVSGDNASRESSARARPISAFDVTANFSSGEPTEV